MSGVARGIRGVAAVAVLAAAGTGVAPGWADEGVPGAGVEPAVAGLDRSGSVGLALIADDRSPMPGEEAVFRATVVNDGGTRVKGALLAQHVSEELEIVEAGEGVLAGGVVNWRVDLSHGQEAEFALRVRVPAGAVAGDRLTSTACLLLDRDADPTSCARDTLVVGEPTVMSRVEAFVGAGSVRVAGAALGLTLVWLLWRARRTGCP
ncbi:hypothetical protein [Nocardiopsis sp. FIRDI 009]|uniref:hypothetical protein n=1 Tax=Nocardiopsis sp. FIRDI 009 TaxID=714197 RepID=UPI000E26B269|nr:hypothetical protein [Nocardiopsis sp. FIRDI 009]